MGDISNSKKYGVPLYGAGWVPQTALRSVLHSSKEGGDGDDHDSITPENHVVLAGGGGEGSSGIRNAILIAKFDSESNFLSDQPVARLETGKELPYRIAVHPGGEGLICSFPECCRWYEWGAAESADGRTLDLRSSERSLNHLEAVGQQLALAFNCEGSLLATGGEDGKLRVFKWPSMELVLNEANAHTTVKYYISEYTDMIGVLKNRYYDMILSTKLAGLGHASFLFMTSARDKVSYIYPNVNAAEAGLLLSETFTPDSSNLSDGGFHMYHQMVHWLGRLRNKVSRHPVPPLKVSISGKLKEAVEAKYRNAGVQKGKYIVVHGIKCDSKASMLCRGDTDSLLPIEVWAEITKAVNGIRPVFVIPHERERENVKDVVWYDASIVFITTPGQLG